MLYPSGTNNDSNLRSGISYEIDRLEAHIGRQDLSVVHMVPCSGPSRFSFQGLGIKHARGRNHVPVFTANFFGIIAPVRRDEKKAGHFWCLKLGGPHV